MKITPREAPWEADLRLNSPQLPRADLPPLRRDQITQAIRRIITADTIFIGIHLQNILGPMRIML